MIALLQRVTSASVVVDGETVGAIDAGLLVLVAVEPGDGEAQAQRMCERLLGYRVFSDDAGRMNLSLADIHGGLLLVPQFTLAADTRKGTRPGFSTAAAPELARSLFDYLLAKARATQVSVSAGVFGAHMQISLTNDGPVTFWLETPLPVP